jgi:hypothetical protein
MEKTIEKEEKLALKDLSLDELKSKKEELEKKVDELSKELQEKTFEIAIESKSFLSSLVKKVNKNFKWKHNELMGYVMLCNNLKEEKMRKDLDGTISLRTANVSTLYKFLLEYSGEGIHEAKDHLKTLTIIGESVTKAMKDIEDFNNNIRDVHTDLNSVENEIVAKEQGVEVSE